MTKIPKDPFQNTVDHQKAVKIFGDTLGMNEAQAIIEFQKRLDAGEISFNDASGFPISIKEFIRRVKKLKLV